jgi:Arc/MetJ-type ribon-helix-helix transcriptional regulator
MTALSKASEQTPSGGNTWSRELTIVSEDGVKSFSGRRLRRHATRRPVKGAPRDGPPLACVPTPPLLHCKNFHLATQHEPSHTFLMAIPLDGVGMDGVAMDGAGIGAMMDVMPETRPQTAIAMRFGPRPADHEKITVNLGFVDLGHVDLLVSEGVYANRSDFIRTAVRNQIERHADITRQSVARKPIEVGLRRYGRAELEAARAAGARLDIRVLGLAVIADDVPPDLASTAIASIEVLGSLQASPAVKRALADRLL